MQSVVFKLALGDVTDAHLMEWIGVSQFLRAEDSVIIVTRTPALSCTEETYLNHEQQPPIKQVQRVKRLRAISKHSAATQCRPKNCPDCGFLKNVMSLNKEPLSPVAASLTGNPVSVGPRTPSPSSVFIRGCRNRRQQARMCLSGMLGSFEKCYIMQWFSP
ncbi:hypothetical protein EYF80_027550 [Liparis tanakae]|uniref:Uncharacterized protein n=1 Tax=Liparis tanakae TaxID=230148 RepID=A0A4Z2H9H9_9TELE|nr:hypothetical protein EYF80_027550 [Liparis tanakae]